MPFIEIHLNLYKGLWYRFRYHFPQSNSCPISSAETEENGSAIHRMAATDIMIGVELGWR